MHPDDIAALTRYVAHFADMAPGEIAQHEFRFQHIDGSYRWIHTRHVRFEHDDDTGTRYVLGVAEDVTEQRRAQQVLEQTRAELAHLSRVTTLGEFAASIVHELSQPLSAIGASTVACVHWLERTPPLVDRAIESARRAALDYSRAADLLERVGDLVRTKAPARAAVDMRELGEITLRLIRASLDRFHVTAAIESPPDLPAVYGDRVQLRQVLMNLVSNAIEAMKLVSGPRRLDIGMARDGPGHVIVRVRDTGPGIPPEEHARIFKPFHTTKRDGIGIGLSISNSIVDSHCGRLWVESSGPDGTTFGVVLPMAHDTEIAPIDYT